VWISGYPDAVPIRENPGKPVGKLLTDVDKRDAEDSSGLFHSSSTYKSEEIHREMWIR
jgi:hypothetical protein